MVQSQNVRPPWGRVVVGVDDSEAARAALGFAAEEAARRGAELHVISVWSMPGGHVEHAEVPGPLRDACCEEARDLAERLVREILGATPQIDYTVAVGEPPVATALATASARADLLVLGSRQRGRLAGLVLGSVGTEVIHRTHCPVTFVPAAPATTPSHNEAPEVA